MLNVVLVAPFLGATMLKCLSAFTKLPNIRLGLISHQPEQSLPNEVQKLVHGHYRIGNCLDPEELLEATTAFQQEWDSVDRLIGYLEHLQGPLAEVRSKMNIHGMKKQTADNFRDKNQMKATLRQFGLPVAKQAKIHSYQEVEAFIQTVGYPIILKPLAGVGSKNTARVNNEQTLLKALNTLLPSQDNPVQAEQFIKGEEHTLEAVKIKGKVVWQSSTYYLPGPLQVLENPWMQYCVLLPKELAHEHVKKFLPLNAKALAALGMNTGLSHMEWFLQSDKTPIISEVGARPPGVNIMPMLSYAHEVDMWAQWANLMVFEQWEMPQRKYAVGCAFLRAKGVGRTIQKIQGVEEALQDLSAEVVLSNLPKIGQPRSPHYEGDGWIMVRHEQTKEVINSLRKLITTIRIER